MFIFALFYQRYIKSREGNHKSKTLLYISKIDNSSPINALKASNLIKKDSLATISLKLDEFIL